MAIYFVTLVPTLEYFLITETVVEFEDFSTESIQSHVIGILVVQLNRTYNRKEEMGIYKL